MRDYEPDNLVMDCRRAMELGYGVHYGHYKADHPHTRDTSLDPEPEHKYPERECKNCGEPFWPHRGDQIYCSWECQEAAYKKRGKRQAGAESG